MNRPLNSESVYINDGNKSITQFLNERDRKILDIGCGAGSNGRLIRELYPSSHVTGITCSQTEYEEASKHLNCCIYADLDKDNLFFEEKFDVLLFCHVLEHLVDPVSVIKKLLPHLKAEGKVIILVPNIATWRERWKLALGRFEYTESGIMDKTHLHFYTFHSAHRNLIDPICTLQVQLKSVTGNVPLAFFRHHFLTSSVKKSIDDLGCKYFPNLFGNETIIVATLTKKI